MRIPLQTGDLLRFSVCASDSSPKSYHWIPIPESSQSSLSPTDPFLTVALLQSSQSGKSRFWNWRTAKQTLATSTKRPLPVGDDVRVISRRSRQRTTAFWRAILHRRQFDQALWDIQIFLRMSAVKPEGAALTNSLEQARANFISNGSTEYASFQDWIFNSSSMSWMARD